jgi:hypothetical protein
VEEEERRIGRQQESGRNKKINRYCHTMKGYVRAYTDKFHYCFRSCMPCDRQRTPGLNPGTTCEARFLVLLSQNIEHTMITITIIVATSHVAVTGQAAKNVHVLLQRNTYII